MPWGFDKRRGMLWNGRMNLASSFVTGLLLIVGVAPLGNASLLAPLSPVQEILIDQWSDADYRLSCKRPANTILIPPAVPNIEGRAGLVTLGSGNFTG